MTGTEMRFGIYLPPQAENGRLPVLYWLSGLNCTEANFIEKAGAQRVAAELGLIIVTPVTSPRGRPWCTDHRPEKSAAISQRVGIRTNLLADELPLGRKGAGRLSR